jgi:hypothetical protein
MYFCVGGLPLPILVLDVSPLDRSLAGFFPEKLGGSLHGNHRTPKAEDISVVWPFKSVTALSALLA